MSDKLNALRAIVQNMPPDGSVTLPVALLADLVAESNEPGQRLLTLEQAAEFVGRSTSTVRTWLNTEQLAGFKLNGRDWRIRESALQAFIERQEAGEHKPPTVTSETADLSEWRTHTKGAA